MSRRRFSGDFLLQQYRDAVTESISEQTVYKRIDEVFTQKLNQFEEYFKNKHNEDNKSFIEIKNELHKLISEFSKKYENIISNHQQTLSELKSEFSKLLNQNLTKEQILKIINNTIEPKITELQNNIQTLPTPTITYIQNTSKQAVGSQDAFEIEYQNFIQKLKQENENRKLKNQIIDELKKYIQTLLPKNNPEG